jgi:hypothetical protein
MQELVESTKGFVSQSPRAATVTAVSCAVAITSVALLLAGVHTGGTAATTPPAAAASVARQPCGTVAPAVMPSRFCQYTLESAFGVRANWRQ